MVLKASSGKGALSLSAMMGWRREPYASVRALKRL
jgi:hypothetical protein